MVSKLYFSNAQDPASKSMLMRSEAPHFWRVFLTNAEINRLGTLETAETGQPCATVGYLYQEQLQECEAARVKAAKRDNIE